MKTRTFGFTDEELASLPPIKEGDMVDCLRCGQQHEVHKGNVAKDDDEFCDKEPEMVNMHYVMCCGAFLCAGLNGRNVMHADHLMEAEDRMKYFLGEFVALCGQFADYHADAEKMMNKKKQKNKKVSDDPAFQFKMRFSMMRRFRWLCVQVNSILGFYNPPIHEDWFNMLGADTNENMVVLANSVEEYKQGLSFAEEGDKGVLL